MDRKSQILLVFALVGFGLLAAYNLRPRFCINSPLIDSVERIEAGGNSALMDSCNSSSSILADERLKIMWQHIAQRLHPLERYLTWNFLEVAKPVRIVIFEDQSRLYRIYHDELHLSIDQINSGALERGVFKIWLSRELGGLESHPDIVNEAVVDLYLHAAGYDILSEVHDDVIKYPFGEFPSSRKVYCESAYRLPEHHSICQASYRHTSQYMAKNEVSILSARPILSLRFIEAFNELRLFERLSFASEFLKGLTYSNLFPHEAKERAKQSTSDSWEDILFIAEHTRDWLKLWSEGHPELSAFTRRAQAGLDEIIGVGYEGEFVKMDLIYNDVEGMESLDTELSELQEAHPQLKIGVTNGERIWIYPNKEGVLLEPGRVRAEYVLTVSCGFPQDYALIRQLSYQKWLAVRRCGHHDLNLAPLASKDTDNFAVHNPHLSFIQFDLPSLEVAFNWNQAKLKKLFHQSQWELSTELIDATQLEEEASAAGSTKARAAIPGVEAFRL